MQLCQWTIAAAAGSPVLDYVLNYMEHTIDAVNLTVGKTKKKQGRKRRS